MLYLNTYRNISYSAMIVLGSSSIVWYIHQTVWILINLLYINLILCLIPNRLYFTKIVELVANIFKVKYEKAMCVYNLCANNLRIFLVEQDGKLENRFRKFERSKDSRWFFYSLRIRRKYLISRNARMSGSLSVLFNSSSLFVLFVVLSLLISLALSLSFFLFSVAILVVSRVCTLDHMKFRTAPFPQ